MPAFMLMILLLIMIKPVRSGGIPNSAVGRSAFENAAAFSLFFFGALSLRIRL